MTGLSRERIGSDLESQRAIRDGGQSDVTRAPTLAATIERGHLWMASLVPEPLLCLVS